MNKVFKNICISSKPLEVADFKEYKMAIFLISVLDTWDLNRRMIPKETGIKSHKSIVGFPILAKLVTDRDGNSVNFGGHEFYLKIGENGFEERFGTTAIGSVIESWIEDREVDGYDGKKSCILIKAKLWSSRFPEYFKVFDNLYSKGNIASSWELAVRQAVNTAEGRILKAITFIGNTLLGSGVLGAVPKAGVLEYAETNIDELMLATALSSDIYKSKEVKNMEEEVKTKSVKKVTEHDLPESGDDEEVIDKKDPDKYEKVPTKGKREVDECRDGKKNMDVAGKLIEKDNMILELSAQIKTLEEKIKELKPFKAKVEEIEKAESAKKLVAERELLKESIVKTGLVSKEELETSEEIKSLIEKVDKIGLNSLIVDRLVASRAAKTETSSKLSFNITAGEEIKFNVGKYIK